MPTFTILIVILVIVACLIALVVKYKFGANRKVYGGATSMYNCSDDVLKSVYDMCVTNIDAVGTPTHIVKYLERISGLASKELIIGDETRRKYKYANVYALLQSLCERVKPTSAEELILLIDLRYCWFLSKAQGSSLVFDKSTDPLSNDEIVLVQSWIDEYAKNTLLGLTEGQKLRLLEQLKPSLHLYRKFVGPVPKTPAQLAKCKTTIDSSIRGLIAKSIMILQRPPTPVLNEKSIAQRLVDVDLIAMYPREPYLVKAFVDRIKKEIKLLEDNTLQWRNMGPLSQQILRDELLARVLEERPRWDQPNTSYFNPETESTYTAAPAYNTPLPYKTASTLSAAANLNASNLNSTNLNSTNTSYANSPSNINNNNNLPFDESVTINGVQEVKAGWNKIE